MAATSVIPTAGECREDGTGRRILVEQNAPHMLDLLRAKSGAYDSAQSLYRLQFLVAVVVPACLAVMKVAAPQLTSVTLILTAVALALDWGVLDRLQEVRKTFGAQFQERFDCALFGLPWRADRVGPEPTPEDVRKWAHHHPSFEGLRGWYPAAVARLPHLAAVAVCQRANGTWNAKMRERYGDLLLGGAVLVLVATLVAAAFARAEVLVWISWIGLSTPVLGWLLREGTRQRKSASASRKVAERAQKLWQRVVRGETASALMPEVRELQNDIYDLRRRDQQVPAFVYDRFRDEDEEAMQAAAEHLVEEYWRPRPAH